MQLGGTIGDIESMPFVEAFRQFQFRVGQENFMLVHVSLVYIYDWLYFFSLPSSLYSPSLFPLLSLTRPILLLLAA